MPRDRIHIVTADARGREERRGNTASRFHEAALTRDNYRDVLEPLLGAGDFLLNLSVDVSSMALIALCQRAWALSTSTPASSPGPAATSTAA